jgi:DNA-binding NtrC family response regulator
MIKPTKPELRKLVKRHKGNTAAAARELGITRQGLGYHLKQAGLADLLTEKRDERRPTKAQVLEALAATASYAQAFKRLKMKRRTFYSLVAEYKITVASVEKLRAKSPRQ